MDASEQVAAELGPDPRISRFLLSTPANFIGSFADRGLALDHAFTDDAVTRHDQLRGGPYARSHFVVSVGHDEWGMQSVVAPDHSWRARVLADLLAVWYGKRWDFHGTLQAHGVFQYPVVRDDPQRMPGLGPYASKAPRNDLGIALDLRLTGRIASLLYSDDERINPYLAAARSYAKGVRAFNRDSEEGYLQLVSGLEILAGLLPFTEEEIYDAELRESFALIGVIDDRGPAIVRDLKGRLYQLRARAALAGLRLTTPVFFDGSETEGPHCRLHPANLANSIKAAYDIRSKYLHAGARFGFWIEPHANIRNEASLGGRPVVSDGDWARILSRAPSFLGLERLLRFMLLRYAHLEFGVAHERLGTPQANA